MGVWAQRVSLRVEAADTVQCGGGPGRSIG